MAKSKDKKIISGTANSANPSVRLRRPVFAPTSNLF